MILIALVNQALLGLRDAELIESVLRHSAVRVTRFAEMVQQTKVEIEHDAPFHRRRQSGDRTELVARRPITITSSVPAPPGPENGDLSYGRNLASSCRRLANFNFRELTGRDSHMTTSPLLP